MDALSLSPTPSPLSKNAMVPAGTIAIQNQYKQDTHNRVPAFPSSVSGVGCLELSRTDAVRAESNMRGGAS